MRFDPALLEEFRALLQTTGLQRAHGEFVRMFRWLRAELERQMPDFRFQNAVSGSAIDYAYFTFSDEALRREPGRRPPLGRRAQRLPAAL